MTKKEAWEYYKTWMKEKTFCKALKTEIKITRKGWDHIITGGVQKRSPQDSNNKFQLLKVAKLIIKLEASYSITVKNKESYYCIEKQTRKYLVRVLLKKDSQGKYYFYSVMKH